MPPSILIADDYEDNRELLRLILEAAGYHVREARNGRECVSMAQINVPDLFLVDLFMPVLDGWGVLAELREDARTRAIPCIAVTAYDSQYTRPTSGQDFDAYIAKPFKSKELLDTIARLLEERAAEL
ncbi:MAG TPA: response regulator [Pyrinomonadaceae bacterium]|nr:response regulator [Pyrinomonadaceae bacterium]